MSDQQNYRATVIRDDHREEDWGFYELRIDAGTLGFRCNEETRPHNFDHYLAAGTWREVRDVVEDS